MSRRDTLLLVLLSAIWGSSFLFIKVGVEELESSVVVLGRLVIGAVVLLPLLGWAGGLHRLRESWRPVVALGLLNNVLPFWLLGYAEERLDSGLAAVIQAAAPILTVVLALRIDRTQRATGPRLVGIVVGFTGVALLVGMQPNGNLMSALAVVLTALCYAASVLVAGRTIRHLSPISVSFGQLATGAVLIAPFAFLQLPGDAPSGRVIGAVVALGSLGSAIAYLLYFALIRSAGASRAILVTYLVPAFALVYGAIFLDEPVTGMAIAGLALILGGTALATGLARTRRGSVPE